MSTTQADVAVVEDVWGSPFEALSNDLRIVRSPSAWPDPIGLAGPIDGIRALVVRNRTQVTRELMAALPSLQVIARAGVGLDNIDLAAAEDLGIVVVAARGANAGSVAEFTIGAAISLARKLPDVDRRTRAGEWTRTPGRELAGQTWGLLGLGATGKRVALLAAAFGMRVIAHDPFLSESGPAPSDGIRLASLTETVEAADVLSVHVPATEQTRDLVDAELLARLSPGALLVNVARGDVIDEEALADAIESGHLGGAALDVRLKEPPVTGRLETLDNVLLTPHVAGITAESQYRISQILADDIAKVLAGGDAQYAVGRVRPAAERSTR